MGKKKDFDNVINKIKAERDGLKLKIHLGSMEAKKEFEEAEKKWEEVRSKASEIADDAIKTSDEYIAKAKIIGEELKDTYGRITKRLSNPDIS